MKKRPLVILSAIGIYFLILLVLVLAEADAPGASIHSFGDGLWYSLVTLTTVGYGDLFPVTPVGRLAGVILVLCSLGLLTALISAMISFFQGGLLPKWQLSWVRKKTWYLFDGDSEDVHIFCRHLKKADPDGVILFLTEGEGMCHRRTTDFGYAFVWAGSMETAVKFHSMNGATELFFLGNDGYENYRKATEALRFQRPVYCRTWIFPENVPKGLTLFHEDESLGRIFWQQYPIGKTEKHLVLIGGGTAGEALLEQGLLNNVLESDRILEYHVFCDEGRFLSCHNSLEQVLSLNRKDETRDSLIFHEENWTDQVELLQKADRIILCMDSDEKNLEVFSILRKYFVTENRIYVRLHREMRLDGACAFGAADSLLKPEFVMKQQLSRLAREMHEIYRKGASYAVAPWEELSTFLKRSNLAAADHLSVKIRLLLGRDGPETVTPELCALAYARYKELVATGGGERFWELEHRRWMRFHAIHNWRYAPIRDNDHREHPLMIPYEDLPEKERCKDDYAWRLLAALSDPESSA